MEQGLPSTVLIVEDEIMVAVDLADYLTEAGYRHDSSRCGLYPHLRS